MTRPFIFTDDPLNLVQVYMTGSVGRGGKNNFADVTLIQSLINAVPEQAGGPSFALAVDGLCGNLTSAAISRFQSANGLVTDGRIDWGKATIQKLVPFLRDSRLLPRGLSNVGEPDPKFTDILSRGFQSSDARSVGGSRLETKWRFTGSGTAGFSIGPAGVTGGDFLVSPDDQNNVTYRLSFGGITAGISIKNGPPIGFDVGFENLPTLFGSRIYKGYVNPRRYDKPAEFIGTCVFLSGEINLGPGVYVTIVQFEPSLSFITNSFGLILGTQVGIPTVGVSLGVGAVVGWR